MRPSLLFMLVAGLAVGTPAAAKTYKWVDDRGVTHYGETIPPEYANKDRKTLNKSGTVVRSEDILTPEERRQKEAETAKHKAEVDAARDQKRHDKSLISTYSSVEEIELSRVRNIQQVEARIKSIMTRMKMTNTKLQALLEQEDSLIRSGQKVPASLDEDIKQAQLLLDRQQLDLDKYNAEKKEVEARFDADKARYRELTGK